MPGLQQLLGTRLSADINLAAQLSMLTALWVGFYFAHKKPKNIPNHRNVQTTVVLTNILFILFVMIPSAFRLSRGFNAAELPTYVTVSHMLLGASAELCGIYLVLRMRTQIIPVALRVKNYKLMMRTTLGLFTATVVFGLGIYYFQYLQPKPVVLAQPTPTLAPTQIAIQPTATAILPTFTPEPTRIPPKGDLRFSNDVGLNDVATVNLVNVPPPSAGKIYQAWFASSDVALVASAGPVNLNPDGTAKVVFAEPKGGNLIALYDQFFITLEAGPATKPASDPQALVFSGQFADKLAGEIKLLLGAATDTPNKAGYLSGLHDDIDHLLIHADELKAAFERGNLATTKRHAEHIVNLLEGKIGKDYGDLDKSGAVEDPGDGYGMLVYLNQVASHAQAAGNAPDAVVSLKQDATTVQTEATNVNNTLATILKDARAVLAAKDLPSLSAQVKEIADLAPVASRGVKLDGSSGFQKIFFTVQDMGGLALVPHIVQVAKVLPPPTPTPPPAPTPTAVAQAVTVFLQDFSFKEKTITIKKGTTVIFVNQDPAKHTVTSDTNVFDSGDLAGGAQFTFTFGSSGTFPYFCRFHGDKGGVDMSGVIVVQ